MVTLIRTLKRITTSTSPPTNESSKSKTATVATGTDQNFSANHVHHGQLKKIETTANDAIEMSKKERTSSDNTTSPQNSSDEKSAAVNSNEKNTQTKLDQKRKASTHEELPTKKAAVNKYKKICSTNGCTHVAVQGGVCMRHGARRKLCCTNMVVGEVCARHVAKVTRKRCSREECTNQAQKGGVCIRHGAQKTRCSSEGCTNFVQKGGVCIRHGAQVKLCSSEGCANQAKKGGVCIKHGAYCI